MEISIYEKNVEEQFRNLFIGQKMLENQTRK
jgi:hypothetical protein